MMNDQKGKLYIISAASGAGKTTLMSIISGLEDKQSGKIYFDDKEVKNLERDRKRLISVILPYHFFPG